MAPDSASGRSPVSHSSQSTSGSTSAGHSPQLSGSDRVNSNVSSVAMDRGLFTVASAVPETTSGYRPPSPHSDEFTDAEIMLRVKAGDETAFAYLVEKYRRAMVSF